MSSIFDPRYTGSGFSPQGPINGQPPQGIRQQPMPPVQFQPQGVPGGQFGQGAWGQGGAIGPQGIPPGQFQGGVMPPQAQPTQTDAYRAPAAPVSGATDAAGSRPTGSVFRQGIQAAPPVQGQPTSGAGLPQQQPLGQGGQAKPQFQPQPGISPQPQPFGTNGRGGTDKKPVGQVGMPADGSVKF